jgi:CubicO group peptidase (beta-lactamase class C family)
MPSKAQWISGPTESTPAEARFDPSRLERLEGIFQALVEQGKAQCASYALSRHGRVFANRSIGPGRYDRDRAMQSGTWRKIASISKVLTAMGILKLVEDGRLMMEMPICHVLPELAIDTHRGIRFFHVLTHTSGLSADPGYHCEPNPDHGGYWKIYERKDWVEAMARLPLAHEPGAKWSYSTLGFALLGEIIARVTGEPYHRWMEREILQPSGMRDTFFAPGDRPDENFSLVSEAEAQALAARRISPYGVHLPGGGGISTCLDLLKLGQVFLDGLNGPERLNEGMAEGRRILGKRTLEAMRTLQVKVPAFHWGDRFEDWRYGLGLEPARHPLIAPGAVWGHEGSGRCSWWFSPADDFVAAWTLPTTLEWDPDFCWTPRAVVFSGLQ